MKTVTEFLEAVGRQEFRVSLGLKEPSLTRATDENLMPSGWYLDAREFCASKGVEVPEHLFRWSSKRKSPLSSETQDAQ